VVSKTLLNIVLLGLVATVIGDLLLLSQPLSNHIVGVITAVSGAVAAIFAALSARGSVLSANAARDAVDEARRARRAELTPTLILEKDFLDLDFVWPHPKSLNGEAVFLARRRWKDKSSSPPTFTLQNFGRSPALEVTIIFELEDPNGDLDIPKGYEEMGLSVQDMPGAPDHGIVKCLMYAKPNGGGRAGLPLYHKYTIDVPSCSPNQARTVEFPIPILNTLFLRGLQYWERRHSDASSHDLTLTAKISCYDVDSVNSNTQFRWRVIPFHNGQINPVVAHCNIWELSMYEKPEGSRVA
jgi:hypothetical protein